MRPATGGGPTGGPGTAEDSGAIAAPNVNPDVELPLGLGTYDIAQALRLNDD